MEHSTNGENSMDEDHRIVHVDHQRQDDFTRAIARYSNGRVGIGVTKRSTGLPDYAAEALRNMATNEGIDENNVEHAIDIIDDLMTDEHNDRKARRIATERVQPVSNLSWNE